MNKKRILAEFEIEIPDEWNGKEDMMIKLFHDYIRLNRFVSNVVHVTAFPMNYKLIVQHLELPVESVN